MTIAPNTQHGAQGTRSTKRPGLVDLQLNGYAGFDFNAPAGAWHREDLLHVRLALRKASVVMALPTLITDAPNALVDRAKAYCELVEADERLGATFPGLHIEGPFISPENGPVGAHPQHHCVTPHQLPDLLDRLIEASGERIRILTLAPELEGAMALIEKAARLGILVAIGHTTADAETLDAAVIAGAHMATHLGNGSHMTLPRHDNYIQHQLADDRLAASFIADGHHIPFPVLKNFLRAKTLEKAVLVTDAMAAAGAGPGRYRLGEKEVVVSADLKCQIPGQQNLAGSALTMEQAVLNVTRYCKVPFEEAWTMASTRPAALAGLPGPELVDQPQSIISN